MFSKRLGVGLFPAVLLCGCNLLNLNDPPEPPLQVVELGSDSSKCLTQYSQAFLDYLDGKKNENQSLSKLLICSDDALTQFANNVRGKEKDVYSRGELTAFLNRYFLAADQPADEKFLDLFFLLKTSLVGGSKGKITSVELNHFSRLLKDLIEDVPRLERKLNESAVGRKPFSFSHVDLLRADLVALGEKLGKRVDSFRTTLELRELIEHLKLLPQEKSSKWLAEEDDLLKIFGFFKSNILKLGDDQKILSGNWKIFLKAIVSAGAWTYELNHGFKDSSNPYSDKSLENVESLVRNFKIFWEDIGNPAVSVNALENLPLQLKNPHLFFGHSAQSTKELFQLFFAKMTAGPGVKASLTFGMPEIQDLSATLLSMLRILKLTNQALKELDPSFEWNDRHGIGTVENLFLFKKSQLQKIGNPNSSPAFKKLLDSKLVVRSFNDHVLIRDYSEFFDSVMRSSPIWTRLDEPLRVLISQEPLLDREFSAAELATRFLFWTMNSRLFDTFGSVQRNSQGLINQLEKKDFAAIYNEIRTFGIEVNWFDPNSFNAADLRHREADLFMWSSNGNQLMELDEATELFVSLVSVRKAAQEMHRSIVASCEKSQAPDFTGNYQVKTDCMFSTFFSTDRLKLLEKSLPAFVAYYEKLDDKGKLALERSFEKMFRTSKDLYSGYVTTERMTALLQYEEMLIQRFDSDRSGTLDAEEIEPLFKLLESTLKTASESSDRGRNRAVLAYLLKTGKMPNSSLLRGLSFLMFESSPSSWDFSATRSRIFEVFAVLAAQVSTKTPTSHPAAPVNQ